MLTPIKIENRMNAFFGKPAGGGKKPAVIHLHERYGIVQHTTDLGEKFVQQGYVTIVPDLFSRFTGDRDKLAKGDDRCDLDDGEVLKDIDAVVEYLRAVPEVDMSRIAISGEMPARPLIRFESVARVTPRAFAPSVTVRPSGSRQASLMDRPGWGGSFMGLIEGLHQW